MDKLKLLLTKYFELENKCDGTAATFATLYPLAKDLAEQVKDLQRKTKSREVRYFAFKLYQDVSDMEIRFWKYTI